MHTTKIRRAAGFAVRLLPTVLVVLALGVVAANAAQSGSDVEFIHGSMDLSGSGLGSAPVVGLLPGELQDTGCTVVRNAGTLPVRVRMYGTTEGTGLDRFINLTVTAGRFDGAPSTSCRGFVAGSHDRGMGPGVLYGGSLRDFPDDYASGLEDSTAPWLPGEAHAYQVTVRVRTVNEAQGLTASQTFNWETRQLDSLSDQS